MRRVAIALLLGLFAAPAAAQERGSVEPPAASELTQLQDRVAALESRIAALEAEKDGARPTGEAIDRVGQLADRAMRRLVDMVRVLKHGREGEAL